MISIVICSRNKEHLQQVSGNIGQSIGVPYEIIAIDNEDGKYGICSAYNLGAVKSKYNILCFIHEDITIHSTGWGKLLAQTLMDKSVGLLGIMGSTVKTLAPSGWSLPIALPLTCVNIIQRFPEGYAKKTVINPNNELIADVVSIDGVWLATRKEVWQQFPFDEKTFPHFHLYDLDLAMQVQQRYRVCVFYGISVEHFSIGNFDLIWCRYAELFSKKWRNQLPKFLNSEDKEYKADIEFQTYKQFTKRLIKANARKIYIWKYLWKCTLFGRYDDEMRSLWSLFLTGKNINPISMLKKKFYK